MNLIFLRLITQQKGTIGLSSITPPPKRNKKITRDNKLKKKQNGQKKQNVLLLYFSDSFSFQSVCSIGVVFLTLIHLYRHCSYFIMAQWSKALGSWVRIRWNLWVNYIEMILRKSYFHKKVYIVCFLNIHIYNMLPHLRLSNYFVSSRETLSKCNGPHEFEQTCVEKDYIWSWFKRWSVWQLHVHLLDWEVFDQTIKTVHLLSNWILSWSSLKKMLSYIFLKRQKYVDMKFCFKIRKWICIFKS